MRSIVFVRHAESLGKSHGYNTDLYNQKSAPLSDSGQKEAEDFASLYKGTPSLVVVSPYVRTQQTASFLISKFPDVEKQTWDEIHEFNYLEKFEDIEERKRRKKEYWNKCDPYYRTSSEHESFSDFFKRVLLTIEKIKLLKYDNVVIFSHAKFMKLLALVLVRGPYDDMVIAMKDLYNYSYHFKNCDTLKLLVDDLGQIYVKGPEGINSNIKV